MGPVMNLALALIVMALRALPGRRRAGLPAAAGRHRQRGGGLGGGRRPASSPATASSRSTAPGRDLGGVRTRDRHQGEPPRQARRSIRDGKTHRARHRADGRRQVRGGRDGRHAGRCARRSASCSRVSRREAPACAAATSSWRSMARSRSSHDAGHRLIRANEGKPLSSRSSATARRRPITVTPEEVRRHRSHRRADQRARSPHRPAESARSVQAERQRNWEWAQADRPDARRAVHARNAGEAADGPGGDRRTVR